MTVVSRAGAVAAAVIGLGAGAVPSAMPRARATPLPATAARTITLQETGRLHPVDDHSSTIDERGTATGTYNCAIVVRLTIASVDHVTAAFTVHPSGGSLSGTGAVRYVAKGGYGYFGGTIRISRGLGSYAHASGSGIGISGTINRETFSLTVHVHGTLHA